jgi:uncharacterized protein (DUF2336 family)
MSSDYVIAELESAVTFGTSARRVDMLRRVTDLFLVDADRFNDQQVGVFDDVLVRIIECVEAKALEQLSISLCGVDSAPIEAVRRLAFHKRIAVARPALKGSNRITDRDLVTIAQTRGLDHLLAISERKIISADVTDVLLRRDDVRITNALTGNAGAKFSDAGYDTLVKRADVDEGLAGELGLRPDLPLQLLSRLLSRATDAARERMIAIAPPEIRMQIDRVLGKLTEEFGRTRPDATQYDAAEDHILALNRNGKLTDSTVNRFAIENQTANIIVAIAVSCSVRPDTIEPLMVNARTEGLVVACRAADLSWNTTLMILRNRFPGITPSQPQTDEARNVFDSLSLSAAQLTIRFWAARTTARRTA